MRKTFLSLISIAMTVAMVVVFCVDSTFAQLRVPPTHVAVLASQSNDDSVTVQETETVTITTQNTIPVTPIQHVMPAPTQVASQPQVATPVTTPTHPQLAVVPQDPQVQSQMQLTVMPQPMSPSPGMTSGAIVVPVTVPQYMTYTPQPVTMMVNRPAQLVIPQYPTPMQQPMYDPMAMQMMQQQMMMQMMMQQQMMAPPRPPQQPIPVKMILPDGSTVSIKHYVPGNFFKNVWRAVTP